MAYVSRDPFAREETHREAVKAPSTTCAWCGQLNRRGQLYRYRTETDGGRQNHDRHAFCSIGCRRTYYGA